MSREDLRRSLEQLHAELGRAGAMDEATRDRLQALQAEIASVLEHGEGEAPIRQRLEDGLAEFEASHPALARRLAQVIDTLAFYNL